MPLTNDIERLHGRIAELEARVAALEGGPDDGWITWNGGERPVGGDEIVEVRFRDGDVFRDRSLGLFWAHDGDDEDIIAYRVVK